MPGPVPSGVLAMASSSLPAQDGSARARVATTARAAKKKIMNTVLFRMQSSSVKIMVRCARPRSDNPFILTLVRKIR